MYAFVRYTTATNKKMRVFTMGVCNFLKDLVVPKDPTYSSSFQASNHFI